MVGILDVDRVPPTDDVPTGNVGKVGMDTDDNSDDMTVLWGADNPPSAWANFNRIPCSNANSRHCAHACCKRRRRRPLKTKPTRDKKLLLRTRRNCVVTWVNCMPWWVCCSFINLVVRLLCKSICLSLSVTFCSVRALSSRKSLSCRSMASRSCCTSNSILTKASRSLSTSASC